MRLHIVAFLLGMLTGGVVVSLSFRALIRRGSLGPLPRNGRAR